MIPETREAGLAVNLEEWLGNGAVKKSVISLYFLNNHESFDTLSVLHCRYQRYNRGKG